LKAGSLEDGHVGSTLLAKSATARQDIFTIFKDFLWACGLQGWNGFFGGSVFTTGGLCGESRSC